MSNKCSTDSLMPLWTTITCGTFSLLMIFFTITISVRNLKTNLNRKHILSPTATATVNKANASTTTTTARNELDTAQATAAPNKPHANKSYNNKAQHATSSVIEEEKAGRTNTAALAQSTEASANTQPSANAPHSDPNTTATNTTARNNNEFEEEKARSLNTAKAPSSDTNRTTTIDIEDASTTNESTSDWEQASFCTKFKWIAKDVFSRKAVYVPLVTHLADTATDIASIAEFYIVANSSSPEECGGLNIYYLFYLSITCMMLYRIISAYKMWQITDGSWMRAIFQFFDVELYHILYFSHKWCLRAKSAQQSMISVLEAVFEGAPQSVIQLVYLLHLTDGTSTVVLISVIFSFINLTLSIASDDRKMFRIQFSFPWKDLVDFIKYFSLIMFRIMDVPPTLIMYSLIWVMIDGYTCFGILLLDLLIGICLYVKTKNTDALLSVVATPLWFGDDPRFTVMLFGWLSELEFIIRVYWSWSVLEAVAVLLLLWLFPSIKHGDIIRILLVFCTAALLIKLVFGCVLFAVLDLDGSESKERTVLYHLLYNKMYDDALEIILFKNTNISSAASRTYGGDNNLSLLTIACRSNNERAAYVVAQEALDNDTSDEVETGLMAAVTNTEMNHVVAYIVHSPQIDFKYIKRRSKHIDETTAFYYAIEYDNMEATRLLIQCMHRLANKEQDPLHEIADLLNNVQTGRKRTVFHAAAFNCHSLEWFLLLYDSYLSPTNANNALSFKDEKDKTALDLVDKKYNDEAMKQEIKEWMISKTIIRH